MRDAYRCTERFNQVKYSGARPQPDHSFPRGYNLHGLTTPVQWFNVNISFIHSVYLKILFPPFQMPKYIWEVIHDGEKIQHEGYKSGHAQANMETCVSPPSPECLPPTPFFAPWPLTSPLPKSLHTCGHLCTIRQHHSVLWSQTMWRQGTIHVHPSARPWPSRLTCNPKSSVRSSFIFQTCL